MNAKKIKAKLAAGEPSIGAWQTLPCLGVSEVLSTTNVDWLCVDMEHGTASLDQAAGSFAVAERHGVAGMARLPHADPHLARGLLDAGAHGILVSTVEDPVAFADFVAYCLYPPRGKRGVGLSRCNRWGDDFKDYLTTFEPVIAAMIETIAGVENAAAIAAIDGVDALFIGPYDLSASLGKAGDFTSPEFLAAKDKLKAACDGAGIAFGFHQVAPEPDTLRARIEEGYRFIAYGTDAIAIRTAMQR